MVKKSGSREAGGGAPAEAEEPSGTDAIIGVGIRMPKSMHEELRLIAFRGRVSLNSLLVEGAQRTIEEKSPVHGSKSSKK
jgi:hypothetical protein